MLLLLIKSQFRFSGGFVTIKAGTGHNVEEFHVHEDVIKQRSEYFRRAFDAKWQEGKTRIIEFPEDSTAVVEAYVEWYASFSVTWIISFNIRASSLFAAADNLPP